MTKKKTKPEKAPEKVAEKKEKKKGRGRKILAVLLIVLAALLCVFIVVYNLFSRTHEDGEVYNEEAQYVFTPNETEQKYLLFLDDFTEDEINTDVWNIQDGVRRGGYWSADEAFTKNGCLVLRTEEKDGKYYMGTVDTQGKMETGYGYYEARLYQPKASGIWTAFWLMSPVMAEKSTADVTVGGSEIDIIEAPYYNSDLVPNDSYQCAVHVGDYDRSGPNFICKEKTISPMTNKSRADISIYDGWHTFGVEWTEDYYRFYYDRQLVYEVTEKEYISPLTAYWNLSIELNGSDGVPGDPAFVLAKSVFKNPEGTFPTDFLVDYVAMYSQRPF